jgi:hypothetical protein
MPDRAADWIALRAWAAAERAAQYDQAADHEELTGRHWQAARCFGAVEMLDRLIILMDGAGERQETADDFIQDRRADLDPNADEATNYARQEMIDDYKLASEADYEPVTYDA